MKSPAKQILLSILFVYFSSLEAYSQCYLNTGENSKFSIELGAGLVFPSSPSTNDLGIGDATKFELGLRYLPEGRIIGLRGYYSYASFKDIYTVIPATSKRGDLKIHRIELQGLYMLDDLLNIRNEAFELESYLGIGAAFGKGSEVNGTNSMLSTSLGLRPRYLLLPKLHFYLDASYTLLYNQQIDYAGRLLNAKKGNLGSMLQLSLGLSYRL